MGSRHSAAICLALSLLVATSACQSPAIRDSEQRPVRVDPRPPNKTPTDQRPVHVDPLPPQETTTNQHRFRDSIGLTVKFGQGQPLSDLPMLSELGVGWVRDHVDWSAVEPEPGKYVAFPPSFRQRLQFYREHDIGVVFLLAYQNDVAYPATDAAPLRPIDPAAFGRYAVEAARQLRAAGLRFVLEIWNEPHNFVIRPMVGGAWNGKLPSPWVDHYVRMVWEAVGRVKAFDPAVKLLSDEDMWVVHYWFLERGLPSELDGFAFHPYSTGIPEIAAVAADTDWMRPFVAVDVDRSFVSAVRRLRDQGARKLGHVPEMWVTEWGYPVGTPDAKGVVTEEQLAGFLPRAYVIAQSAGVKALCWFSSRDSVDGPMGLMANDGTRRRSYFALKTLSLTLGDSTFVAQLTGKEHPTWGAQSFLFQSANSRRLVVWNLGPTQARLILSGCWRGAGVKDAEGNEVVATADSDGQPAIPVGSAPLYVTSRLLEGEPNPRWSHD